VVMRAASPQKASRPLVTSAMMSTISS
jgi:hypothetical protein